MELINSKELAAAIAPLIDNMTVRITQEIREGFKELAAKKLVVVTTLEDRPQ